MCLARWVSACALALFLCVGSCAFVRKELSSPVAKEGEQITVSCAGNELTASNLLGLARALESATWETSAIAFGATLGKQVEACVLREIAAAKVGAPCAQDASVCATASVAPVHAAMLIAAKGITYK